jgi:SAM-dependent methyltransferase
MHQGYEVYPLVEEEINAALDRSLDPAGPDQLYDFVAGFGLAEGSVALDVGCGEGGHTEELARRFGFTVVGVDPVQRHLDIAQEQVGGDERVSFRSGAVEAIPMADATVDLVWCRDVLVHVRDLRSAYNEIGRVLKRGGRALVYQMVATDLLEPREAALLERGAGVVTGQRPEEAIVAAGLRIDRIVEIGSEWGEWSQENNGGPARKLVRAARLGRSADVYIERYGRQVYDMAMADCLWHVYAMIGKLTRRAYLLSKP